MRCCARCAHPVEIRGGSHCNTCLGSCKIGTCTTCRKEYNFFPEHDKFIGLAKHFSFCCAKCLNMASQKCSECSKTVADNRLLICDGCGTQGQTCLACANLPKIPDGPWYCCVECNDTAKEIPPPPHRKRPTREEDEKAALFDYLVQEHKAMENAVSSNNKYARVEELSKQQQAKEGLGARIVELDANAAKSSTPRPIDEYLKRVKMAEEYYQMPDVTAELAAAKAGLVFPKPDFASIAQKHMDKISDILSKHSK